MAGRFADRAWLAELAAVRDPAQIPAVVAAALGVREQPGVPVADVLARVLARQQLLLVLDNCEHVVGGAAALCAGILLACDDVRVLATSREPLRVAGEARYRLGPLALPGPGEAADAAGCEAVVLFADRARQADVHFALTGETGVAVAQLVARLDGMPLAIELAAARVEALGVSQLLDRIDDRFALLDGGDRLAPSRQQSLAATVEWSYQLLSEPERRVFRLISVFPGPFTLDAAEAVAGAGAGPGVLHLVDCSLLVPPRPGLDGRARYVMLETLRAYGARLLAGAGEQDAAAAALAVYALGVAEQAAAGLQTSTAEAAAARRLDAEDATMRQVLAWAIDHDAAIALRLAVALAPWWLLRGRLTGEYPLLRQAAGRAAAGGEEWCTAHFWLGQAALHAADPAGALDHFTAVRDAIGDGGPSRALGRLPGPPGGGVVAPEPVRRRGRGRPPLAGGGPRARLPGGGGAGFGGPDHRCPRCRGHRRCPAAGPAGRADPGCGPRLDSPAGQLRVERRAARGRDLAGAVRSCAAGLAGSREAGDLRDNAKLLMQLAYLDLQAARTGDTAAHLRESLEAAVRTGGWLDVLNCLDVCGYLCAATGRCADAVTAWSAHLALKRHEGYADWPVDARRRQEALREARQVLGPARARAAGERGAAMSLATAAEYALLLTAPEQPPPAAARGPGKLTSSRERELVSLVAQGRTDAQIAAQLYISVRTVHTHLQRIRDKTGCRRRADLTRLALQARLI